MKKPQKQQPKPLSPENYIKNKARLLPIHNCYISRDWKQQGMGFVIIVRIHRSGNLTFGTYLIDLFALGVKDTAWNFNQEFTVLNDILSRGDLEEIEYNLAHNIIFGSLEFAAEHGFKPHRDFEKYTKYILEIDDNRIPLIDIEFGKDGKPLVIIEPFGR